MVNIIQTQQQEKPWAISSGKNAEPDEKNGGIRMKRNWEDLAQAIILKAVEDYRHARRRVRHFPDQKGAQATIREVERFFRSRWFAQLTDIDGEYLIRKLKEEVT